jgi:hypothetical protein
LLAVVHVGGTMDALLFWNYNHTRFHFAMCIFRTLCKSFFWDLFVCRARSIAHILVYMQPYANSNPSHTVLKIVQNRPTHRVPLEETVCKIVRGGSFQPRGKGCSIVVQVAVYCLAFESGPQWVLAQPVPLPAWMWLWFDENRDQYQMWKLW